MSARCLCSGHRYSEWRLDLLQQLYALSPTTTVSKLPFLHPSSRRQTNRRWNSSKSKNPVKGSWQTPARTEEHGTADSPRPQDEGIPDSTEQNRGLPPESDNNDEPSVTGDGRARRRFDPVSEEGRAQLHAALDSLKNLYNDIRESPSVRHVTPTSNNIRPPPEGIPTPTVTAQADQARTLQFPLGPFDAGQKQSEKYKLVIPARSPLIDHVQDRKRRSESGKTEPDPEAKYMLDGSYWARLLAEPVRQCAASHVRAPEGLLTKWNFVENDEDGKTYLSPGRLASLSAIRRLGEGKEFASAKSPYRDDDDNEKVESQPAEATGGHDISHDIHNFRPTSEPATVNILPHLNLVRHITTHVTKMDPDKGELVTVAGGGHKLVPLDLRMRVTQLTHFERQRQFVKSKSYMTSTVSVPNDVVLAFDDLQWDAKIAGRVITILRERVVTALTSILKINATRPADPKTQRIDLLPADLDDLSLWAPPEDAWNDLSSYGRRPKPLHACLFLHIAPWPHAGLKRCLQPSPAVTPSASTVRYLPPTIPVTLNSQERAPVFPLLPLLGHHHVESIHAALDSYLNVSPQTSGSTVNPNGNLNLNIPGCNTAASVQKRLKSEQGYTILFRNATRYRMVLEKELSRLWRYVGGRDALEWWEHGIDLADQRVWGDPRPLAEDEVDIGGTIDNASASAEDRSVTGNRNRDKAETQKWQPLNVAD